MTLLQEPIERCYEPAGSDSPATALAWDAVAEELSAIPLLLERVRYAAAIKFISTLPKRASILELGCGAGRVLRALSGLGYENLTGLEISRERLGYVQRAGPRRAKLVCADGIPFADESFEGVVSAAVIEHVPDPERFLREVARVTKAGGVVSIVTDTYMWRWLKQLGLYRTVQPLDEAIWPARLIGWAREAGLELAGCGGFVNVPEQELFFVRQLKRLTSLRRWYCLWRGIKRQRPMAEPRIEQVEEVPAILEAIRDFRGALTEGHCFVHLVV